MLKNKKNAIIFSIFAMLLWGSAIPLIKSTYLELGILRSETGLKILTAGIRFFMAGIVTLILYRLTGTNKKDYPPINIKFVIILALVQTAIQYIFYYIGLSNTAGVKSAIIQATNAFIVVILSAILLPGDRINPNIIIALILGTAGVFITNTGKSSTGSSISLTGEGFIFIATFFNALASILIRKYGKGQNPFKLTAYQFLIGSGFLIIIGIITAERTIPMTSKGLLMLSYGAFVSAAAFSIWTIVLQYHSANEFGVYKLFIPIFGSILSVIFLGEMFTKRLLIGMILVLAGS
ncbi:DMT family transporter, partial [Anaerococcus provencensis]|uniref:DMT family transporter n=1 Tax=Anaerococcus provencensis TaxID=938293 RepID=UPI0005C83301